VKLELFSKEVGFKVWALSQGEGSLDVARFGNLWGVVSSLL